MDGGGDKKKLQGKTYQRLLQPSQVNLPATSHIDIGQRLCDFRNRYHANARTQIEKTVPDIFGLQNNEGWDTEWSKVMQFIEKRLLRTAKRGYNANSLYYMDRQHVSRNRFGSDRLEVMWQHCPHWKTLIRWYDKCVETFFPTGARYAKGKVFLAMENIAKQWVIHHPEFCLVALEGKARGKRFVVETYHSDRITFIWRDE